MHGSLPSAGQARPTKVGFQAGLFLPTFSFDPLFLILHFLPLGAPCLFALLLTPFAVSFGFLCLAGEGIGNGGRIT